MGKVMAIRNMLAMKNYKMGLSFLGIAAVVLVMLPNVISLLYTPPNDVLSSNETACWFWNALESIGRFGLMGTLCFVVNKNAAPTKSPVVTVAATGSLLVYYALWVAYFAGAFNGISLVGMAFFPSVFFLLAAWRQRNGFAFAFAALFAIVHVAIISSNFLF